MVTSATPTPSVTWRRPFAMSTTSPPRGRAKIQDLYDLHRTPTVAGDRQKVLLEILAPNFRPAQVTDDLAGFWTNTYPELKKELKRRYPGFIWNSSRSLELMRPATARIVTGNCPVLLSHLPLYLGVDGFETPFCCYGNDVDCDRCGAWAVFAVAARWPGPWDSAQEPDPL